MYAFKVQAVNQNGAGPLSPALSLIACNTPAGLKPPTVVMVNQTAARVRWEGPADSGNCSISSYHLLINSGSASSEFALIDEANIANKPFLTETTLDLSSGFVGGVFYEVKVNVETQGGVSLTSNPTGFTLAGPPQLSTLAI